MISHTGNGERNSIRASKLGLYRRFDGGSAAHCIASRCCADLGTGEYRSAGSSAEFCVVGHGRRSRIRGHWRSTTPELWASVPEERADYWPARKGKGEEVEEEEVEGPGRNLPGADG